jgi:N-acetylglutamate synthase
MLSPDERALRIEEAALRAWPAHADSDFDGWRLRFADGYTRRANSITPLGASRLPLDDKIATCERLYAQRGLPVIFRLTPFAHPDLDGLLARRGYRFGAEVEVRARSLTTPLARPRSRAVGIFRAHPIDRWLDIFGVVSGAPATNRPAHRAILKVVPGIRRLWVLWANGKAAACGMSVFSDGLMGIFDLITAAEQRKLGYGSEIVRRTLLWGARAGADEAYLQVLGRNNAARRLYDRAGFEVVYQYHYRERL